MSSSSKRLFSKTSIRLWTSRHTWWYLCRTQSSRCRLLAWNDSSYNYIKNYLPSLGATVHYHSKSRILWKYRQDVEALTLPEEWAKWRLFRHRIRTLKLSWITICRERWGAMVGALTLMRGLSLASPNLSRRRVFRLQSLFILLRRVVESIQICRRSKWQAQTSSTFTRRKSQRSDSLRYWSDKLRRSWGRKGSRADRSPIWATTAVFSFYALTAVGNSSKSSRLSSRTLSLSGKRGQ